MSHNRPPTQFTGKTWIFIAQALVVGGLGIFSLILGPLFLFGVMKDARGQPAPDAGVALTIMSVPFLLSFALAVFNVVTRRRPIIRVCREGLVINMIGSSSLDGIPLIPTMIRAAWLIVSLQGFKQQILVAPWESLQNAAVSGPPMARTLTIVGPMFRAMNPRDTAAQANQITFRDVAFVLPLHQIAGTIQAYWRDPESRQNLPGWNAYLNGPIPNYRLIIPMAHSDNTNGERDVRALIDHRLTDRCRSVLRLASKSAENLGHGHIAPEHVLIALVAEGDGVAAHVLMGLNVHKGHVATAVEDVVGRGATTDANFDRPFTSGAEQLIREALDEASTLGHNYVGTEHLLLALTRDGHHTPARVFFVLNLNREQVRNEVLAILGHAL